MARDTHEALNLDDARADVQAAKARLMMPPPERLSVRPAGAVSWLTDHPVMAVGGVVVGAVLLGKLRAWKLALAAAPLLLRSGAVQWAAEQVAREVSNRRSGTRQPGPSRPGEPPMFGPHPRSG